MSTLSLKSRSDYHIKKLILKKKKLRLSRLASHEPKMLIKISDNDITI